MNRYRIGILIVPVLLGLVLPGCARLEGSRLSWLPQRSKTSALLATGRTHEQQRDFAKARDVYLEMTRIEPANWQGHHRLAVAYTLLGQHDLALPRFQKARELAPDRTEVLVDFGYAQAMQNDLPGAEQTLREALVKDPRNEAATKHLAMVVAWQGRIEESLALSRKVTSEAEAHAQLAYTLSQVPMIDMPVQTAKADSPGETTPAATDRATTVAAPAAPRTEVPDSLRSAAASVAVLQARRDPMPAAPVSTADVPAAESSEAFGSIEPVHGQKPANPFEPLMAKTTEAAAPVTTEEPNPFAVRERAATQSESRFAWAEPAKPEPPSREQPAWWEAAELAGASEKPTAPPDMPPLPADVSETTTEPVAAPQVFAESDEPAGYVAMTFAPEPEPAPAAEMELADGDLSGFDPSLLDGVRSSPTRHSGWDTLQQRGAAREWLPAPPRNPAAVPIDPPDDLPPGFDAPPGR